MNNVTKLRIQCIVKSMVLSHFAMFCNPESRGSAFTWEKFPEITQRFVKSSLFLYFPERPTEEMYEYAFNETAIECDSVLDLSGFLKQ